MEDFYIVIPESWFNEGQLYVVQIFETEKEAQIYQKFINKQDHSIDMIIIKRKLNKNNYKLK